MALKLPRIPSGFRIVREGGTVTNTFQIWWQRVATAIELSVNGITAALTAAGIALDAADVALDAAAAANDAADNAQGTADVTASETSLTASYIANFTDPFIEAADDGTVTIAAHDRVYGNSTLNPTVSVGGDIIGTTAVSGETVRFYYVDPTRAGGTVTYLYTIDPAAPPVQSGDTHSVGAVEIPAAGTSPGRVIRPPGYVEL